MRHPNEVYSSRMITNMVWGPHFAANNASQHVKLLRDQIEQDPKNPRLLRTAGKGHWDSGYILITDSKKEGVFDRYYHRNGKEKK